MNVLVLDDDLPRAVSSPVQQSSQFAIDVLSSRPCISVEES